MKALIIGGGIAGPVTAMALRRAGLRPIVFEAHGGPAEHLGLFLGLGVNGMRVLKELDLISPVLRRETIPTPWMTFSSTTGKQLGTVSNGWLDDETPSVTIMRGDLQGALAEEARARGIELYYGKRLVEHRETEDGVVARFADGTEAEGDLLIAADGIRSRVRRRMLPEAPGPSYTGLLNLGGVTQASGLPPTPGTMHMIWGSRAFFGYTVREDGEAWWFSNVGRRPEPTAAELAGVSTEEWRARLLALFADDPPFVATLIEGAGDIGASPIHDMPSLPTWHRGRAVVLGDAAHAVSPSAGQGASMALEDALMLAKCLRDHGDPGAAFARFEALRRPRAEKIVATGRRRGLYKAPRGRLARWARDLLMPVAFRLFATEKSMAWIYDYEIPWEEPVGERAA